VLNENGRAKGVENGASKIAGSVGVVNGSKVTSV
jgi:hypothetical protein